MRNKVKQEGAEKEIGKQTVEWIRNRLKNLENYKEQKKEKQYQNHKELYEPWGHEIQRTTEGSTL